MKLLDQKNLFPSFLRSHFLTTTTLLILLSPHSSYADNILPANKLLEIQFNVKDKAQVYTIKKLKKSFELQFKNEKKKIAHKTLTTKQVDKIKEDATRIVFQNEYKKPTFTQKCIEFAIIKTESQKSIICEQNIASTEQTKLLKKSLKKYFHK